MSIKQNAKGYYIQDEKGTIHARNIPTKGLANRFFKAITEAQEGL